MEGAWSPTTGHAPDSLPALPRAFATGSALFATVLRFMAKDAEGCCPPLHPKYTLSEVKPHVR